jgi:hypothetical protein
MHIPKALPTSQLAAVRPYSSAARPGPRTLEGRTFELPSQPGVRWPAQVYHGTQVDLDYAFRWGIDSPQCDGVDPHDTDLMRDVLAQHLAGPHEDHSLSLRQDRPFYGSQFVATSRDRGIGEEFAVWHPADSHGWLYFIDLKRLAVHHGGCVVDGQPRSGYAREKEISVLHHVPADCLIGALRVRREGLTGVQPEPDDNFVPNPNYVPDPTLAKDEL